MDDLNTVDSILQKLEEMAQTMEPINPGIWLLGASKLVALVGNEQDRLCVLENMVSNIKLSVMNEGGTASKARVVAEASPEYLEARKLKAKIERVYEVVRLAKIQSRMSLEEYRSQFN